VSYSLQISYNKVSWTAQSYFQTLSLGTIWFS